MTITAHGVILGTLLLPVAHRRARVVLETDAQVLQDGRVRLVLDAERESKQGVSIALYGMKAVS